MSRKLHLRIRKGRFAVCRLAPQETVPSWVSAADSFTSVSRTRDELSIVCAEDAVPPGIQCAKGWRILEVQGPLDFAQTGILASLASPLADAGVSIFAISTYDTDYVLVEEQHLDSAVRALTAAGHTVER
ncbi:MAG: ACT domain-containing protein [Bryobacteraceae bacterium]|jgi:hypothetical protein